MTPRPWRLRGVTEHLFPALDHPGDVQAREGLARASLQAGLAFTNALLGATHAISHQIGGLTDLPHGLLNAIMLPHVMEFNAPVAAERLAEAAVAMGVATGLMSSCEAADAAIQTVRALVGKASLPASLREIGVRLPQIDGIARRAGRRVHRHESPAGQRGGCPCHLPGRLVAPRAPRPALLRPMWMSRGWNS